MNTAELFLPHVRDHIIPTFTGDMVYGFIGFQNTFSLDSFLYLPALQKPVAALRPGFSFLSLKKN